VHNQTIAEKIERHSFPATRKIKKETD